MKIAIDVSPLFNSNKTRGVGFYLTYLKNALEKFFPENTYSYFTRGQKVSNNADLVHYPYFEPFFLSLPFLHKKKTVVTVHDLTPVVLHSLFPVGIRGVLKWRLQWLSLRNTSAIITDSRASKRDIARIVGYPEEKIHTVYLAAGDGFKQIVDNKQQAMDIKRKYDLPDAFALYVGDVTPNKNLPRLVNAALQADIPLVMVGKSLVDIDGDFHNPWLADLKVVQKLAKKNTKKVMLIGFVPDSDLVVLYNMATVFVMPSLYEGFGLPILEAMSCGCPVITSPEGSVEEVTGKAAYFVDAYSVESIENGLRKVIGDDALQKKLSEKGLRQAKKFSWEKTAEETVKAYRKTLASS